MDPGSGSGFCQIKGSLRHSETVPGVSTPKPEPHPVPAGCCALRDLVPAVDELSTREALELELALTALVAFHNPLSSSSSLESKVTGGGGSGEHSLRVEWFVSICSVRYRVTLSEKNKFNFLLGIFSQNTLGQNHTQSQAKSQAKSQDLTKHNKKGLDIYNLPLFFLILFLI